MANKLKNEGNQRFQSHDFVGALIKYDEGLEVEPENTAILSNRSPSEICRFLMFSSIYIVTIIFADQRVSLS